MRGATRANRVRGRTAGFPPPPGRSPCHAGAGARSFRWATSRKHKYTVERGRGRAPASEDEAPPRESSRQRRRGSGRPGQASSNRNSASDEDALPNPGGGAERVPPSTRPERVEPTSQVPIRHRGTWMPVGLLETVGRWPIERTRQRDDDCAGCFGTECERGATPPNLGSGRDDGPLIARGSRDIHPFRGVEVRPDTPGDRARLASCRCRARLCDRGRLLKLRPPAGRRHRDLHSARGRRALHRGGSRR